MFIKWMGLVERTEPSPLITRSDTIFVTDEKHTTHRDQVNNSQQQLTFLQNKNASRTLVDTKDEEYM